jgi:aminopeptidase
MDPRIRQHAEILVDHCTRVESDDNVLIKVEPAAEDLVVALAEEVGEIGANISVSMSSQRAERAYLRASDPEDLSTPEHSLAGMETTDVKIVVKGSANALEQSDVPSEAMTAHREIQRPTMEAQIGKRWVGTQFPVSGEAQ